MKHLARIRRAFDNDTNVFQCKACGLSTTLPVDLPSLLARRQRRKARET